VTLVPVFRWFAGLLGVVLLGFALVLAWVHPEAASVVGFVTAGTILLVGALIPRLPTKVTVAGTSAEWKEALVRQAYITTIEREAPHIIGGDVKPPGVAYGPDLADVLAKVDEAETPEDLWRLITEAESIARTRITIAKTGALG